MAEVEDFVLTSALIFPRKSGSSTGDTFATKRDTDTGHHEVKTQTKVTNTDPIPTTLVQLTPVPVSISSEDPGTPILLQSLVTEVTLAIDQDQTIIIESVPIGKIWSLKTAKIVCGAYGSYRINVNGDRVDAGITSPDNPNNSYSLSPGAAASGGDIIEVIYNQSYGPTGTDVAAFIRITEV